MDTDKKTITRDEFKRLKKLLAIARSEVLSLYRTKSMICEMLPQVAGLGFFVDEVVDHYHSAPQLLRRLGLKIERQKPTKGTKKK